MFQQPKDKKAADHVDNAVSDLKNAKGELKNAKNAAIDSASRKLDNVRDEAESTVAQLRVQAREAGEKVQHFLHDRAEDLSHARTKAESTIRSKPLAAAAGAFIAGALLSRLLKR